MPYTSSKVRGVEAELSQHALGTMMIRMHIREQPGASQVGVEPLQPRPADFDGVAAAQNSFARRKPSSMRFAVYSAEGRLMELGPNSA